MKNVRLLNTFTVLCCLQILCLAVNLFYYNQEQTRGTQPLPITDSRLRSKKTKKGKRLLTSTKIHDSKNEAKVFSANIEDNSISSLERPGGIVTKVSF